MDEDKSREYRKLVAKVKLKYRENTICKGNLRLCWCDLVPGEDLCQEINLWTYWQGFGYAKETPHIKYMLLGQDFGPPEKEEVKGPKKRTPEDDEHFSESFEKMIHMAIQNREGENNGKE